MLACGNPILVGRTPIRVAAVVPRILIHAGFSFLVFFWPGPILADPSLQALSSTLTLILSLNYSFLPFIFALAFFFMPSKSVPSPVLSFHQSRS